MRELTTSEELARVLGESRTIAVLGAHASPERPAHYVPAYLETQGYRVLPVNAALEGTTLFGQPVRGTLAELGEPVDIVDVFRRSDALFGHLDDLLAMAPLPRVVWLQSGISNDDFAARLIEAGIEVVQSRCTFAEHKRLGLAPLPR